MCLCPAVGILLGVTFQVLLIAANSFPVVRSLRDCFLCDHSVGHSCGLIEFKVTVTGDRWTQLLVSFEPAFRSVTALSRLLIPPPTLTRIICHLAQPGNFCVKVTCYN